MTQEQFNILLQFNAQFADLRRAREQVGLLGKAIDGVKSVALGLGLPTTFGAGVSMLVQMTKAAVDYADAIKGAADNIGITTDALQSLNVLARESGGDVGALENSLNKLQSALQDGWENAGKNRDAFQKLGVSMAYLRSIPVERQFEEIALSIAKADDKQAAFSAAADLLGEKNLPKLKNTLNELAVQGYDKVAESAKGAARFMSAEAIARLDAAGDAWNRFVDIGKASFGEALAE